MTLGMAVSSRGESRRDAVDFHESASNARADMSPRPPPPSDVMVTTHDNQSPRDGAPATSDRSGAASPSRSSTCLLCHTVYMSAVPHIPL